jgi:hypothetical protein
MPRPVDDQDLEAVRRLHGEGMGCAKIAREIGRAKSTVSGIARDLGLTFDRAQTREATKAQVDDAKARRARLASLLLDDALALRAQLWAPCKAFNFGGKDNTYNEVELDEPTFADKLKIVQSAGLAAERHARLVELDADTGAAGARSVLGQLADALNVAADQIDTPTVDEP